MTSHLEEIYQASWQERQTFAENMQPIIGQLFRNKGIEISVYGRPLLNASAIDIIKGEEKVFLRLLDQMTIDLAFCNTVYFGKIFLVPYGNLLQMK